MSEASTEFIPYYKIPRIIETIVAIILIITWSMMKWEVEDHKAEGFDIKYAIFLIDYTTNGTFVIIFIIDVICQISGDPIDYTPMFLFLVTATVLYLCCAVYIVVLLIIKMLEIQTLLIIHVVFSFLMTIICAMDIHFLIYRKCGYK